MTPPCEGQATISWGAALQLVLKHQGVACEPMVANCMRGGHVE